jgi:response regulator NasT
MPDQTFKPSPERILVADDEYLMATGLASSIRSLDYQVLGPVSDSEAAIELAREDRPDLALMDIRMPRESGVLAAETIWNELRVPIVLVSAYSDRAHVEAAQQLGVFGYLLKPVSVEHLRVAIAIGWARATAHLALEQRVTQLEQTLTNRKLVEQAKWLIIERKQLSEPEAHARLQKIARNNRRSIAAVAQEIIDAAASGGEIQI